MDKQKKGRGRLIVSRDLMSELLPSLKEPTVAVAMWDTVGISTQEHFEMLQNLLHLPKGYQIIGLYFDVTYGAWTVILEHDEIPISPLYETLPMLLLEYTCQQDEGVGHITITSSKVHIMKRGPDLVAENKALREELERARALCGQRNGEEGSRHDLP